jgi:hypothetical protein
MKHLVGLVLLLAWVFGIAVAVTAGGFWHIAFSLIPFVAWVNDVIWLMQRFGGGL